MNFTTALVNNSFLLLNYHNHSRRAGIIKANEQNSDPQVKYSLFKNLGWSRFEQGRDIEAEAALQTAIDIANNNPNTIQGEGSAHCLLAQVLERQKQPSALQKWQKCSQLGSTLNPDEDTWLNLANKKLKNSKK